MKIKFLFIGLILLLINPILSATPVGEDYVSKCQPGIGWLWCKSGIIWENWFKEKVIETSLTDPNIKEISNKIYASDKFQKITTPNVVFELPTEVTHYWLDAKGDNDLFEVIIHNISVDGKDNILKFTWNAPRYTSDTINIDYMFKGGTLLASNIKPRSKTLNQATKFNNFKTETGNIVDYSKEIKINETCSNALNVSDLNYLEELSKCEFILISPIYSWKPYDIPITSKVITDFTAIDDINVSACGTLSTANTIYVLNASLVTTTSCITIANSNISINGNGFNLSGDGGVNDYGIITPAVSNLTNITIKNFGNISKFGRGIYLDTVNNSLIYNNTMPSTVAQITTAIYLFNGNFNVVNSNNIKWNATASGKTSTGVLLYTSSGKIGSNNNVSNNNISLNSSASLGYGIQINPVIGALGSGISNSNNILNNNINVLSSGNSIGINFLITNGLSSSNLVQGNSIVVKGTSCRGIDFNNEYNSISNSFISNNINVTGTLPSYGIYLLGNGGNNLTTISNSTINVYTSFNNAGVFNSYGLGLTASKLNTISSLKINMTAPTTQSADIYLSPASPNNIFKDITLLGANTYSVYVSLQSLNNTFTNASYSGVETVSSTSQLIRKWYYTAYVNDTAGNNVFNANITAFNSTGDFELNLTTGINGLTTRGEITDYISVNSIKTYSSPYNIYAINSSYPSLNQSWNVTLQQNAQQNFTLINPTPNLTLISSAGWNMPLPGYSTITGTCQIPLTCKLYLNGINITNPFTNFFTEGIYKFIFNTSGDENYSAFSISNTLKVSITTDVFGYDNPKIPHLLNTEGYGYNKIK